MLPFLLQCVEELPHKIPLYGTVVGLLNLENEDFVKKAVESTGSNFQALFLSVYRNFSNVLMECLPDALRAQTLRELKSIQADEMAVDIDESSAMDEDNENKRLKKGQSNGGRANNVYNVGENEQWCLSTLGYVKAFSRQYASEIWPHIEKLEAELFAENVHPLFCKAVYSGLRRAINEVASS